MKVSHGWSDDPVGRLLDVVPNPKRYYWVRFEWLFIRFAVCFDCGPAGVHFVVGRGGSDSA